MVLASVVGLLSIGLLSFLQAVPTPPMPLFPYICRHQFEPDNNGVDSLVQLVPTASSFQEQVLKGSRPTIVKFFATSAALSKSEIAWFQSLAVDFGLRVSCCAINLECSRCLLSPLMALSMNVYHSLHHGGDKAEKFSPVVQNILHQLKLCAAKAYNNMQPFYLLFKEGQLIVPTVFGPDHHDASTQLLEKYAQRQLVDNNVNVLVNKNYEELVASGKKLEEAIVADELAPQGSFLHAHKLVLPEAKKRLGLL